MPSSGETPVPHNLPVQLTSFVGRGAELAEIGNLLPTARLFTLTGSGGAGKTRVAVEAASAAAGDYANGVWFVDLAPLTDAALVGDAVAKGLGVVEESGRDRTESVVSSLGTRTLLLVLDNCEHVRDEAATLVRAVLDHCPGVTVLATSRDPLGVQGEFEWLVPPMAHPDPDDVPSPEALGSFDAIRLFTQRAVVVQRSFTLSAENAGAVCRLVRRLDGIPLAIELAAAWVRVLGPEHIADRLDDRFRLLTRGAYEAPPRHQTLRAAVDWSFELLNDRQRLLFARLGVFAGGFSLEAAEDVCAGDGLEPTDLLDGLYELVQASMLTAEGDARYRFLETIRDYAREQLADDGESETTSDRHLEWFAGWVTGPSEQSGESPSLDELERDIDNLRAALSWSLHGGDAVTGLRLGCALHSLWETRGHLAEGASWAERLLAAGADSAPPELRAAGLLAAGRLASGLGDWKKAGTYLEQSLSAYDEIGDRKGTHTALLNLGNIAFERKELDVALAHYERSADIAQELGDPLAVANVRNNLGLLRQALGDPDGAAADLELALRLTREYGEPDRIAITLTGLGNLARFSKDLAGARGYYEEALALFREIGHELHAAVILRNLAVIARLDGDVGTSRELVEKAVAIARRLEHSAHLGDHLLVLGSSCREAGDLSGAHTALVEALRIFDHTANDEGRAEAIEGLAAVSAAVGDGLRAARLLGAADILRSGRRVVPTGTEGDDHYEKTIARTRAIAGKAFDAEWSAGRVMSVEEAIEFAVQPPVQTGAQSPSFRREGRHWIVTFGQGTIRVKGSKGISYVAELVRQAGEDVSALDLEALSRDTPMRTPPPRPRELAEAGLRTGARDAGEMLDPQAKESYRRRLAELEDELTEAEAFRDPERAARARQEVDALVGELQRATAKGGRPRKAASEAERARLNVTRAIRTAVRTLVGEDPDLGSHLQRCIRTGNYCRYEP